jgi:hypothetical protein
MPLAITNADGVFAASQSEAEPVENALAGEDECEHGISQGRTLPAGFEVSHSLLAQLERRLSKTRVCSGHFFARSSHGPEGGNSRSLASSIFSIIAPPL